MRRYTSLYILLIIAGLMLAACASIGRPEGGPRDTEPPVFVRSNPMPGALRVDRQKIEVYFDENIKLDNPSQKVIVSPAQQQQPTLSANGHKLTIELRDSLVPDMTYTIDFGDAIQDLNESNILDGFAMDFATGDVIDSLRISGMVFEARTLEPAQGMLVGVYSNLADSAISTLKLERVARTNQYGQFTIRNLKPGEYHVYAINDMNHDFHWDRSEDVAYYPLVVSPSTQPIQVTDTFRSATGHDSLAVRQGVKFVPNDLLLTWFNEQYKAQYLLNHTRPNRRYIDVIFSAPSDTLPQLTVTTGPFAGRDISEVSLLQRNVGGDSLRYWFTEQAIIDNDTLSIATRYLKTDTTDQLAWTTDSLRYNFRDPNRNKKKAKEQEADSTVAAPVAPLMSLTAVTKRSHEVYMPLIFDAPEPIDSIDRSLLSFAIKEDTLWKPLPLEEGLVADSLSPLLRRRFMPSKGWLPGETYKFTIDSAAIVNIYGEVNKKLEHEFNVKAEDEYCNLTFVVPTLADSAVVELLDGSDKVVRAVPLEGHRAVFKYLPSGAYYARLFIDADGDGKYTTGNIAQNLQPEDTYYYPKKINLKQNWDIEQEWDINAMAVDVQKPYEIKKNKPKLKAGEQAPTTDDEEDEDEWDQYDANPFDRTKTGAYGRARDPFSNRR